VLKAYAKRLFRNHVDMNLWMTLSKADAVQHLIAT
jgi:hypothetical protein